MNRNYEHCILVKLCISGGCNLIYQDRIFMEIRNGVNNVIGKMLYFQDRFRIVRVIDIVSSISNRCGISIELCSAKHENGRGSDIENVCEQWRREQNKWLYILLCVWNGISGQFYRLWRVCGSWDMPFLLFNVCARNIIGAHWTSHYGYVLISWVIIFATPCWHTFFGFIFIKHIAMLFILGWAGSGCYFIFDFCYVFVDYCITAAFTSPPKKHMWSLCLAKK